MSPRLPVLILLLLGTLFTAAGAITGLVFGKPMLEHAEAATRWPRVTGKIIESELVEAREGLQERREREQQQARSRSMPLYTTNIVYQYEVNGRRFESNQLRSGGSYATSNRAEVYQMVQNHPVGETVTVYYNPDDPVEALLQPGVTLGSRFLYWFGWLFMSIGGLLLAIAVWLIIRSLTGRRSTTNLEAEAAFAEIDDNRNRSN